MQLIICNYQLRLNNCNIVFMKIMINYKRK